MRNASISPEAELELIVSNIKWNLLRKEFRVKRRKVSSSYAHIYVSLQRLIKVGKIVLKCYERSEHVKVYKRLAPTTRNGGLEGFLEKLLGFKRLLEERFTLLLRDCFPASFPIEIIKIILEYAVSGKQKINIGYFSSFKDEEIQQRKFLSLLNTLTLNLLHSILTHKMDYGGFRIETQMEFCIKDVKAFTELSENGDEMRDFSKFSKIPLPKRRLCSRQISKYFSNSSGRKTSRRKLSMYDSDYASNYL